jgi:hypothetical protein
LLGQHDRTDTWSFSFPAELVSRASQIAVVHTWDPQWLASIEATILLIVAIFAALSNSGKGNGGTGGPMAWPNTAPWTRPRIGDVISGR